MTLPDAKTYYKATVIKTGQCGTGERRDKKDQWKKNREARSIPHGYSQLIFNKGVKATQWRRDRFSTNNAEKTVYPHAKNSQSRHRSYTHHIN